MLRREFIAGLGGAVVCAAWSLAARAQQSAFPMIGFLSGGTTTDVRASPGLGGFHRGLAEQGYAEGRNLRVLYRWAETKYDRLPALAEDLVHQRVAVIVTAASPAAALAAKEATATIPIVFEVPADPVELGLVKSLNRPGGNLTGANFLAQELIAKRLELLHETVPTASSIGYLVNPSNLGTVSRTKEAEAALRALGVRSVIVSASTPSEIGKAFETLVGERIGALAVDSDPMLSLQRDQLLTLTARHAMPAIFAYRQTVAAGGLMSYGADIVDAYQIMGTYTGRILKGERPGDLPVVQSARVELAINMKTAKTLGVTFPLALLGRADEVVE